MSTATHAGRCQHVPLDDLSDAERVTRDTYDQSAAVWAAKRSTSDFWTGELDVFQGLTAEGHVIDVGCGDGRDAALLTDTGYQVTGIDISATQIELARARATGARFHVASMYRLPFPDGAFDAAWMAASLLHIPKRRASDALREVRRVLRPGAGAFVAVKHGQGERVEHGELGDRFFAYYEPAELRRLLDTNSLRVVEMRDRVEFGTRWVCAWATAQ